MHTQQREGLDELIRRMNDGHFTRRIFLERMLSLGLKTSAALILLNACGDKENPNFNKQGSVIVWESEHEYENIYALFIKEFNRTNKDAITAVHISGPGDTGKLRDIFVKMLQSHKSDVDVMSMDIIWSAEFAKNKWTVPIDDKWPLSEQKKYLPGPIQACTFNDHLWAAPHHIDVGLIYYRKDLIETPPNSWNELTQVARDVQKQIEYGYVWQGAQYEGLVCNFVEVLYGYGGAVLDPKDTKKVVVNSPQALAALTKMVDWVGTISPGNVTLFKEEGAHLIWQNGRAAFMRNWPYAYAQGNDPTISRIVDRFDVHAMLYGDTNMIGHSCIGGWQLGINAYSNHKYAAWKFIEYLIGAEPQKRIALEASQIGTLTSIYDDPEVLCKVPFFNNLKPILQSASSRPVSPRYLAISNAIQLHIHQALEKKVSVKASLTNLQAELENIVSK